MTQVVETFLHINKNLLIHSQYLDWWNPGSLRHLGISNHDIYYVELE